MQKGELDRARTLYEEVLPKCRALGDQRGVGGTLLGLAEIATERAQYALADSLYQQASDVFTMSQDRLRIARVDWRHGASLSKRGDTRLAKEALRRAFRAYTELGDDTAVLVYREFLLLKLKEESAETLTGQGREETP